MAGKIFLPNPELPVAEYAKTVDCCRNLGHKEIYTFNPLIVSCFDASDVFIYGTGICLADHPAWSEWKDSLSTGEFYEHVGADITNWGF